MAIYQHSIATGLSQMRIPVDFKWLRKRVAEDPERGKAHIIERVSEVQP